MIAGVNPAAPLPAPLSAPLPPTPGWRARLSLGFEHRLGATILARREHFGPLRVQKALYPEGPEVCHAILLHPPSGIAGGDRLDIEARLAPSTRVLLTTPGAGKWYRSAGPEATQALRFEVASGAGLEWLPQETIVFDAARATMTTRVDLAANARFLGWDVLCLGRRAAGECLQAGHVALSTRLNRSGRPLWLERGRLQGGDPLLGARAGLAGFSVSATLLASGPGLDADLLAACRQIEHPEPGARHGLTLLPDLLVARSLGHSSEAARHYFTRLWARLRPPLLGRDAAAPRIWNT